MKLKKIKTNTKFLTEKENEWIKKTSEINFENDEEELNKDETSTSLKNDEDSSLENKI